MVIDFWGVWCGPCLSSIPGLQQLADQYDGRGVIFVGIHTADGGIEQINQLKELRNWKTPSGLDAGTSITDGETCRSYGVVVSRQSLSSMKRKDRLSNGHPT